MVWTEMGPLIVHNCGYRLSGGEVTIDENGDEIKTGLLGYADNMGVTMTPDESQRAVDLFRNKYPEVKQYWDELDNTSLQSVRHPGTSVHVGQVAFRCTGTKMLQALLPSGRALHYLQPEIHQNEITFKDRKTGLDKTFIKDTLTYMGKDQQTKQWVRKTTHGGHLTENLCQAIARDILMHGLQKAETTGFEVFGHVHDEAMTMTDADSPLTHRDLEDCMRALPPWAGAGSVQNLDGEVIASWPDLPLNAEGYEDDHYRKG
jgi:DNA polymerase